MFIPLLQRERSIDEFVDRDEGCRLATLLADKASESQEQKLYLKEIRGLVRDAMIQLDDRERHIISNRFGLARPLLATLVFQAIIVGMLANGINNVNVMISMFAFNFCWIFVDVYQMATIANVDHSGRFAALLPGAQGLGQIIGPNIAATLLAVGLGYRGVFIMCALSSLMAMLVYATMYVRLKKTIPALADAS